MVCRSAVATVHGMRFDPGILVSGPKAHCEGETMWQPSSHCPTFAEGHPRQSQSIRHVEITWKLDVAVQSILRHVLSRGTLASICRPLFYCRLRYRYRSTFTPAFHSDACFNAIGMPCRPRLTVEVPEERPNPWPPHGSLPDTLNEDHSLGSIMSRSTSAQLTSSREHLRKVAAVLTITSSEWTWPLEM